MGDRKLNAPLASLGLVLVICTSLVSASCYTCGSRTSISNRWANHIRAMFTIPVTSRVSGGWNVELQFSKPVIDVEIWRANVETREASRYILKNKSWNRNLSPGTSLEMSFIVEFNGPAPRFTVRLLGQEDCGQTCPSPGGAGIDGNPQTTPRPATASPLGCRTCCSSAEVVHEWPGNFDGLFVVPIENEVVGGWEVELVFSNAVTNLQVYDAEIREVLNGGKIYRIKSKHYIDDLAAGIILAQRFQASAQQTPTFTVHMVGQPQCCQGDVTPCNPSTTPPPAPQTTTRLDTDAPTTPAQDLECPLTGVVDDWPGNFKGEFVIPIKNQVTGGWTVELQFSEPVSNLQVYRADVVSILNGGKTYLIKNRDYNADQAVGDILQEQFQASAANTPTFSARMIGQPDCSELPTATDEAVITTLRPTDSQPSSTVPPTRGPSTSRTEPATAVPTERRTVPPTQNPTAPPTEPQTAHSTERPTAPPTEPQTVPPTERPTAPPTERPTVPPTEPPVDASTMPPSTDTVTAGVTQLPSSAPYDYAEVIGKSILFYEAQRSGALPADNRVPWRFSSTLNDQGERGEDLTGGWFDAGDYVKFGFPMASTVTVLAWGLVEYRDAYVASGELDNMLDCIKWATDYFIKCHTGGNEFYGQVGDGNLDHGYWGRPEEMTVSRPAFKITARSPGSDLVGETAAALAAAHLAFKQTDPDYAEELLRHAEELYVFADRYRDVYTNAIPNAGSFYGSHSGYGDELAWSAAWLARATGDDAYLTAAVNHYNAFGIGSGTPWAFSWDDKKAGVMLLMYQLTGAPQYRTAIADYLDSWQPGRMQYTPNGLAWRDQWGTNRYAANTAFLALVAADEGIEVGRYRDFAKQQINYMLGDGGRSYVVGFGKDSPHSPHHRSSSCPDKPAPCGWDNLNGNEPNPQVLEGALVGGPDQNDGFVNDRRDYIQNEVACDYNSGFQSALAGLKSLDVKGLYMTK